MIFSDGQKWELASRLCEISCCQYNPTNDCLSTDLIFRKALNISHENEEITLSSLSKLLEKDDFTKLKAALSGQNESAETDLELYLPGQYGKSIRFLVKKITTEEGSIVTLGLVTKQNSLSSSIDKNNLIDSTNRKRLISKSLKLIMESPNFEEAKKNILLQMQEYFDAEGICICSIDSDNASIKDSTHWPPISKLKACPVINNLPQAIRQITKDVEEDGLIVICESDGKIELKGHKQVEIEKISGICHAIGNTKKPWGFLCVKSPKIKLNPENKFKTIHAMSETIRLAAQHFEDMETMVKSEMQKRIILENISEGVIFITPHYEIIWSNSNAHKTEQARYKEKIEGKLCHEIFFGLSEPCKDCRVKFCVENKVSAKVEIKTPEGKSLVVSSNPIIESDGNILGIVQTYMDITRQKEIQEQLLEAKKKAESANETKSIFLATMSHEMKTPLNSIIGFSRILKNEEMPERLKPHIDSIHCSGHMLLHLINDILDITKIEADKMQLTKKPTSIKNMVKQVYQILWEDARAKGLPLNLELPQTDIIFDLDDIRVRQVLLNLVGNAIKFTDAGNVSILVDWEKKNNEIYSLTMTISDTGIGIPKEDQNRIFEMFEQQQSTTTRKYGGTGLGLAISKQLVEKMNGTIELQSEPGKGSIFRVTIPEVEKSKIESEQATTAQPLIRGKVIILEDENSPSIKGLLEQTGANIIEACNVEDAINITREQKAELLLANLELIDHDACDLRNRLTINNPGIGLIGYSSNANYQEVMENNLVYDDIILPPITQSKIFLSISNCFENLTLKTTHPMHAINYKDIQLADNIIASIRKKFAGYLESLRYGIDITKTTEFATELVEYAQSTQDKNFIDIATRLKIAVNTFNVTEIRKIIDMFTPLK